MNSFSILMSVLCVSGVGALPVVNTTQEVLHADREKRSPACKPPSNITVLFARLNANLDTSIYLRNAALNTNQMSFLHNELNMNQVLESMYYGSRTCPSSVSDNPDDPLWMRSLCPWYYNVTDLPPGHFPRVIPQAVCKCSSCIDNNLNQCERVSTNIRVLQETGCQDGFLTYKPKTITHYVGCTCAKRRLIRTNSGSSSGSAVSGPSGEDAGSPCGPYGCASKPVHETGMNMSTHKRTWVWQLEVS